MFSDKSINREFKNAILSAIPELALEQIAVDYANYIPSVLKEAIRQNYGTKIAKIVGSYITVSYHIHKGAVIFIIRIDIEVFVELYNAHMKENPPPETEESEDEQSPQEKYLSLAEADLIRKMKDAKFMVSLKKAKGMNLNVDDLTVSVANNFKKGVKDFIVNLPANLYFLRKVLAQIIQ